VVEVKRGTLYRETVAQGIDYAECVESLPEEELEQKCDPYLKQKKQSIRGLLEKCDALNQLKNGKREVLLYVVGTGKAQRLEKIARFLPDSLPIYIVTFDVFTLPGGERILVREMTEADTNQPVLPKTTELTLEALNRQADAAGTGESFRKLGQLGVRLGLHPRLWKTSLLFAPMESKNRMVFTVWTAAVRKKLKICHQDPARRQ